MAIGDVMKTIQEVDAQITTQVHLGSKRDKAVIKTLQAKHRVLSLQLAKLHEADGETPVDKTDTSGKEFRKGKVEKVTTAIIPATPDNFKVLEDELVAYCQKCKSKKVMLNPVIAPTKGGKNGAKGTCVTCKGKLFRLVRK